MKMKIFLVLIGIAIIISFALIQEHPTSAYVPPNYNTVTPGPTATREPAPTYPPIPTPTYPNIPPGHYIQNAGAPYFQTVAWIPVGIGSSPYMHIWLQWEGGDNPPGVWPPYQGFPAGYIFAPNGTYALTWRGDILPSTPGIWDGFLPCPAHGTDFSLNACVYMNDRWMPGTPCHYVSELWYGTCETVHIPRVKK